MGHLVQPAMVASMAGNCWVPGGDKRGEGCTHPAPRPTPIDPLEGGSVRRVHPRELGFGRLFDTIRDAVIVVDAQSGGIVLWNPAATAIFGYSAEDVRALSVDALVPPRLRPAHRAGLARYCATGHGRYIDAPAVLELPALHRDGHEFPVELTIVDPRI